MEVRFTHPRTSTTYLADVGSQLTAKQAISSLLTPQTGPFLPALQQGENYQLVVRRTNQVMSENMTMIQAGVVDKDVLEVVLDARGARSYTWLKLYFK